MLFKFAENIEWPDTITQETFKIGFIGNDSSTLSSLKNQQPIIHGMPVQLEFATPKSSVFITCYTWTKVVALH
ncbi:MAG: hypothetical protein JXQ90_05680 [Cyclobacteriaceae bacterium]